MATAMQIDYDEVQDNEYIRKPIKNSRKQDVVLRNENVPLPPLDQPILSLDMIVVNPALDEKDATKPFTTGNEFVDATIKRSNYCLTDNGAISHESTLNPCLDFFFDVMQNTAKEVVIKQLEKAWNADPLTTLQLIFQLRDIKDGKGDKQEFYHCLQWLYEHHYKTLMANLHMIPDMGYWKDLLNLLVLICIGEDGQKTLQENKNRDISARKNKFQRKQERATKKRKHQEFKDSINELCETEANLAKEVHKQEGKAKMEEENRAAIAEKHQRKEKWLNNAKNKFLNDQKYRELHLEIARLFAITLKKDQEELAKENKTISLAGKWAPSLDQSHDFYTLIASTISEFLYPRGTYSMADEFVDVQQHEDYNSYLIRVRNLYRKEYYVPLRSYIACPEVKMTSNKWSEINYSRVPSICMKKSKKLFAKHDNERFTKFLEQVASGEKKIQSGTLMPHDLVEELLKHDELGELEIKTTELQWDGYVKKLKESGSLDSSVAICDVSASMNGTPMNVAIALSLLTRQLAAPPFNEIMFTFHSQPTIHRVDQSSTLLEKVKAIKAMPWGGSTNIQKTFDLILDIATTNSIPQEAMVKRLFIFTDMQFDSACGVHYFGQHEIPKPSTDLDVIKEKYAKAGYEMPTIVLWNLQGSTVGRSPKPVTDTQENVAMISGFSGMMLKLFMEQGVEGVSPLTTMILALKKGKFKDLKLVD